MTSRRSLLSLGLPKEILSALTRNGYESLHDVNAADPNTLATELNISNAQIEMLLTRCQSTQVPASTLSTTQSAAVMVQHSQKMSSRCGPLDKILEGGLPRGHILEVSGPPGSPKDVLAVNFACTFAAAGEEVVFVDCENMTSPLAISTVLKGMSNPAVNTQRNVQYLKAHGLPELLIFLHQFPVFLSSHSKVSLLVLNSISFPFQRLDLGIAQKNALLDRVKQSFSKICASRNVTIVTTCQLATKMVNADGTSGTFDTGARGIMMPQLGAGYLPSGRSYRVILAQDGLGSGHIKLLSSPKAPSAGTDFLATEPYLISHGIFA